MKYKGKEVLLPSEKEEYISKTKLLELVDDFYRFGKILDVAVNMRSAIKTEYLSRKVRLFTRLRLEKSSLR